MKRAAVGLHALSAVAIAVAYGSAFLPDGPPAWAPWVMAIATGTIIVSIMILGAARRGRIGSLWFPFLIVLVLVSGGLCVLLALPAAGPGDELFLGLPLPAAILLYGVGFLPTLVVPVAYALTFERLTLGHDDMARVKQAAWARRSGQLDGPRPAWPGGPPGGDAEDGGPAPPPGAGEGGT